MEVVKDLLRSKGMKATPQRIAVYKSMQRLGHASADMVGLDLKNIYPTLTIATIYNVLEMFVQYGILSRRMSSNNKMYFDITLGDHVHLYCEEDNTYCDYPAEDLMARIHDYVSDIKIDGKKIKRIDVQLVVESESPASAAVSEKY